MIGPDTCRRCRSARTAPGPRRWRAASSSLRSVPSRQWTFWVNTLVCGGERNVMTTSVPSGNYAATWVLSRRATSDPCRGAELQHARRRHHRDVHRRAKPHYSTSQCARTNQRSEGWTVSVMAKNVVEDDDLRHGTKLRPRAPRPFRAVYGGSAKHALRSNPEIRCELWVCPRPSGGQSR